MTGAEKGTDLDKIFCPALTYLLLPSDEPGSPVVVFIVDLTGQKTQSVQTNQEYCIISQHPNDVSN